MSQLASLSFLETNKIRSNSSDLSIIEIEIEKLFGKYTYHLFQQLDDPISSLFILYGDNGSGKTTILKLLFHLLSSSNSKGHRSFIAEIPFSKFTVTLAREIKLIVSREDNHLVGNFQIELLEKGQTISKVRYKVNENKKVVGLDSHLFKKLTELQLSIFWLGDDRVLNSDIFESEEMEDEELLFVPDVLRLRERQRLIRMSSNLAKIDRDISLKKSIIRIENWIREQTLRGAYKGSVNVHNLYQEIISRIINSGEINSEDIPHSSQQLIQELKAQEDRSKEFSHFGLMSPLNNQELINIINNNNNNQRVNLGIIWNVLKPYIDSVSARLDALQEIQDLLKLFVNTINNFFHDKKIDLHIRTGLKITTEDQEEISFESLSSGEKQLLLLFCNTLNARDNATIFIIDEPELSLNIKWQRQLIHALLELIKGSSVQFILATHSIELLAQYRKYVVKLDNIATKNNHAR